MTTTMQSRTTEIAKIDKKIGDLWRVHTRHLGTATPRDYALLCRHIDALLDRRLELMT